MKNRFLDLGDSQSVFLRDVVCVLDADTATVSRTTRDFLKKNTKNLIPPPKGIKMVNSFVLANAYGADRIYQSSWTAGRIKNRIEFFSSFLERFSSFLERKEAKELPKQEEKS